MNATPDNQRTIEGLIAHYGSAYKWYVTATVMLGTFSVVLAATIINVAVPAIMGRFGVAQDEVHWLATGFLAAMTVGMLLNAWAVARFGSRRAFALAMAGFIIASLIGGLSGDFGVLVGARALQGLTAGMIQPHALIVIFQVFPVHRRGQAMGIYGMGVILGPAIAPALGGVLVDVISWRATFFAVMPACALAMGMAWRFLPGRHDDRRVALDWGGLVLLSLSLVALLWAVASLHRRGVLDPLLDGVLVAGLVLAVVFVVWQRRCREPLLDLSLFRRPGFTGGFALSIVMGAGLFASTYLAPLYFQQSAGMSASAAGMMLVPAGLAMAFVFPVAGHLSDRVPISRMVSVGLAFFIASMVLLSLSETTTAIAWLVIWTLFGRLGVGLMMPPVTTASLTVLEDGQLDRGSGIINFGRQIGGALGVNLCAVLAQYTSDFARMRHPGLDPAAVYEAGFDYAFMALALLFVIAYWPLYRLAQARRAVDA
ncbi:drug resistance MFS transporter, drug:H+ antiporter-1 [Salinisphaera dokdonensis CL-ES53]|uniref:Drug resistance MFS transporter, drug:H+ antiporter-1 n=1 Tax=Salinisphaera dokdonensis CL-ES53 TaxID=1304272 RepID=A0ABV2B2T4_9GAMM